jgi:hypothetical protein
MNVKPDGTYSNLWELGDKPGSYCGNAHGQLAVRKIILCLYVHAFVHTNGHNHVKRGGAGVPTKDISPKNNAIIEKNLHHTKLNCAPGPKKSCVNILLQDP